MRFAISAAAVVVGLLLACVIFGQPALYVSQARQQWNAFFDSPASTPKSDVLAQQVAQLQQQVMALKDQLATSQSTADEARRQFAALQQQQQQILQLQQQQAAASPEHVDPNAGQPPVAAEAEPHDVPRSPPPAPADLTAGPPSATQQSATPTIAPPTLSAPALDTHEAPQAPPGVTPDQLASQAPVVAAPEPHDTPKVPPAAPSLTAATPAVISAPPPASVASAALPPAVSPVVVSPPVHPDQEARQIPPLVVPERRVVLKAPPPAPPLLKPRVVEPKVDTVARAEPDDMRSVLARLRQQPPPAAQSVATAAPVDPPASGLPSRQRLELARTALLSGRIDDARRLLQEVQLQLVFRPVSPGDQGAPAAGQGASDVARALGSLSSNDRAQSQRYIERAMDDVAGVSSQVRDAAPEPLPGGYAPAYPSR